MKKQITMKFIAKVILYFHFLCLIFMIYYIDNTSLLQYINKLSKKFYNSNIEHQNKSLSSKSVEIPTKSNDGKKCTFLRIISKTKLI
jgi:hypothetical protein